MLDESVACGVKSVREPMARVRMVDDDPQGGATDSMLSQGDLDEIVGRMHVDVHRAVAADVDVLVATEVFVHGFTVTCHTRQSKPDGDENFHFTRWGDRGLVSTPRTLCG